MHLIIPKARVAEKFEVHSSVFKIRNRIKQLTIMNNETTHKDLLLKGRGLEEKLCMVVIMGVTGAGKSHFINKLAGKKITAEGDSLHACAFLTLSLLKELLQLKISRHSRLRIDSIGNWRDQSTCHRHTRVR